MIHTIGIDVGSGAIKSVLFRHDEDRPQWLARRCERIRSRDPMTLAREGFDGVLADAGLSEDDIAYTATTGEGENVRFATGHFYSMTTHARGGVYLDPQARAVVDIGALNGRAIYVDERGKVLSYKMTGQCASASGQLLDNANADHLPPARFACFVPIVIGVFLVKVLHVCGVHAQPTPLRIPPGVTTPGLNHRRPSTARAPARS